MRLGTLDINTIINALMFAITIWAVVRVTTAMNDALSEVTKLVAGINGTIAGLTRAADTMLEAQIHFDERLSDFEERLSRANL